ncbi:hypothetical protein M747DRAFT_111552 [Aspergillus niger ATCC 13496]|uniref:Uncharacterized protein n=1 Tax=Aspergillus niger ATCC 13496 TaxID=1353008 RepID=A0A370BRB5_ASPNG|nr:hypothetical protein M747DRAFT_111552 [Aspergillus niger ATCC 13496]
MCGKYVMQNENKPVLLKDKDTLLSMHGILYVCILFFLLSLKLTISYHNISYHTISNLSFPNSLSLSSSILSSHSVTCRLTMFLVIVFHGW